MSELNIKNMSVKEFKEKYNLSTLPEGKDISELANLMLNHNPHDKYILVENKLYKEPVEKVLNIVDINKEDVEKFEKLHDKYRDTLVDYREFLYYQNGGTGSNRSYELRQELKEFIKEGREILRRNNILREFEVEKFSTKFFIPDFINNIFEIDIVNSEDEIDCGL